ncbi:uncharacterized protein At3g61260-like [Andrographis paniculata]|uniref:uncharacterized protein At3g61260-like n=1 Tax=Andrographis paniculata TaxID=175694 RepID=UPI0021E6E58E|nr:uncharacterized protein At3g61260-like [Andrographis paniculata]
MDSLIKKTWARYSSTRQDKQDDTRDQATQPQRTVSVKEKRRGPSWMRRQLSRQMSWDYDFSSTEYPTAVAAAAYAVQSLEESNSDKLNKMNSKIDDAKDPPERLKSALKSSDEASRSSFKDRDDKKKPEKASSMKKRISFADTDETTGNKSIGSGIREPERAPPSMTRPPSFAGPTVQKVPKHEPSMERHPSHVDKPLRITDSNIRDTTTPPHPKITTQPVETKRPPGAKPGPSDAKADAWEKEELASIKERYEKLRATIDEWETKKRKKAKLKIGRIEAELDKRRAKAEKNYRSEITRIEAIAGGARAQAEENRRKEELKAQEKASKIRLTGKLPATCLCF